LQVFYGIRSERQLMEQLDYNLLYRWFVGLDADAAVWAYAMSQTRHKLIECVFGWGKQHGTLRKTKHRGIAQVTSDFLLNIIAYNALLSEVEGLIRIPKLIAA
jgi:Transposase domain (DUF772)/Transposase DDE domain